MTRRRLWVLVHRCNGLLLAGFLTVVGLTGSLLAYDAELERVFAPGMFRVAAQGARIDGLAMRERVAAAYPWAYVDTADLTTVDGAALEYLVFGRGGKRAAMNDVTADPYTGAMLGGRRYGEWREGWRNAMPVVYTLHASLALGAVGTTALGVAALLWTFDCFIGLGLSFPGLLRGPERARRFGAAWFVRWRDGGFRRLYDVHRAGGVWVWGMLLMFAWTGVAFDLPVVYKPVMRALGSQPVERVAGVKGCVGEPDWAAGLREGREAMAGRGVRVVSERYLNWDRFGCRWTYRVRSAADVDRLGDTQLVWVRGGVGRGVLSVPTGRTGADTAGAWLIALHEGRVGGAWYRALVCLCGVVTAGLSVTGVWIFLRKMGWVG